MMAGGTDQYFLVLEADEYRKSHLNMHVEKIDQSMRSRCTVGRNRCKYERGVESSKCWKKR